MPRYLTCITLRSNSFYDLFKQQMASTTRTSGMHFSVYKNYGKNLKQHLCLLDVVPLSYTGTFATCCNFYTLTDCTNRATIFHKKCCHKEQCANTCKVHAL